MPSIVGEGSWASRTPMPDPARFASPTPAEVRRLMHALREAVGAFVLRVALFQNEDLSASGRTTRDAMLADVERMRRALRAMTDAFGLELDGPAPVHLLGPRAFARGAERAAD